MLGKCFDSFQTKNTDCRRVLPKAEREDDRYFEPLSAVFGAPRKLPEQRNEFLNVVVERATDYGAARLRKAMAGVPMMWVD